MANHEELDDSDKGKFSVGCEINYSNNYGCV